MSTDERPVRPNAYPPSRGPWTVRQKPRSGPAELPPLTQRYHVIGLDRAGDPVEFTRMGPATPLFTQTFGAIVHGGLVQTIDGPVAVEDLLPGDRVITSNGVDRLVWKGARTILPGRRKSALYRIPADALGLGRPSRDILLGPAARLVSRRDAVRRLLGVDSALVPISALVDGQAIIEIAPISPLQCYHLAFARHCTFTVNGLELESAHPGRIDRIAGAAMQALFLSFFPHLERMDEFGALSMQRVRDDLIDRIVA
ncbi:type I secretion protein [Palleronia sediminis]|uniref:Type I secretion protein n=1 Tax=Palleronia sediminis TaxID=2547833 RepID=A0A4R6AFZ7_9RHOB|nr:Hint domain-containing protein [Palleronia sediminis]TDL81954.1 type I secretion protein [Palleronia sediminis]